MSQPAEVLVVGGGPAGLAAASWLARYRRRVLVADSGEYRSARTEWSHGYLGRDPQEPLELLRDAREELLQYPTAQLVPARVSGIEPAGGHRFVATLADLATGTEQQLAVQRVVLACGVVDELPAVTGMDEHYGSAAFHCSACDGYEAAGQDVVALGWDARLVGFATGLLTWARSVTVLTGGGHFAGDASCRDQLAAAGIPLVEEGADALLGVRGELSGVRLADGRVLKAQLVFFSIGHQPRLELATQLGCRLDEDGYVSVDERGETSVPGVYAAGDLSPGLQLVQVAAAKGVVAGVNCAESLTATDGGRGALG